MKVICDRAALLDVTNLAAGVVAVRTPRPQLTCVKVEARQTDEGGAGQVTLSATDNEVSLRLATGQVEVQKEGGALIPADKLRQIVAAQDADPTLTLDTDKDKTTIRGTNAKYVVYGFPASDFPAMAEFPTTGAADSFTVSADLLQQLVQRTIFSTARENSRYAINGVLLKRIGKKLELVATDGRRLALARGNAEPGEGAGDGGQCIVPTKALSLILKLLPMAGKNVRVAVTDNQILFAFDDAPDGSGTILASNLVEGTFPPYEDVIPKDQDKRATLEVGTLSSAVKKAALLTNEDSRGVRMAFASDHGLRLSSRAPEMGEAEIEVELKGYEGDAIEVGFNPAFIVDALKVVSDDDVIFELKAQNKPGLIKSGQDFLYVVMPVNLQ
jgi:DNA polymerase-3 subunit beta